LTDFLRIGPFKNLQILGQTHNFSEDIFRNRRGAAQEAVSMVDPPVFSTAEICRFANSKIAGEKEKRQRERMPASFLKARRAPDFQKGAIQWMKRLRKRKIQKAAAQAERRWGWRLCFWRPR